MTQVVPSPVLQPRCRRGATVGDRADRGRYRRRRLRGGATGSVRCRIRCFIGLRVMLNSSQQFDRDDVAFVVANANTTVREVLKMSGFDTVNRVE